jgi:hypothetical protein
MTVGNKSLFNVIQLNLNKTSTVSVIKKMKNSQFNKNPRNMKPNKRGKMQLTLAKNLVLVCKILNCELNE